MSRQNRPPATSNATMTNENSPEPAESGNDPPEKPSEQRSGAEPERQGEPTHSLDPEILAAFGRLQAQEEEEVRRRREAIFEGVVAGRMRIGRERRGICALNTLRTQRYRQPVGPGESDGARVKPSQRRDAC